MITSGISIRVTSGRSWCAPAFGRAKSDVTATSSGSTHLPRAGSPRPRRESRVSEFARTYVTESIEILRSLDVDAVDRVASGLAGLRDRRGRLFVLGVGGSAAHASHAVNDFRKLCGIEAYAPTDNVSELTARTNDDGWETVFSGWLR